MTRFYLLLFVFGLLKLAQCFNFCKEKEWFSDEDGECKPCKPCKGSSVEFAPCLPFSDTLCFHIQNVKESEVIRNENSAVVDDPVKVSPRGDLGIEWSIALGVMSFLILLCICSMVFILVNCKWRSGNDVASKKLRRVFSRSPTDFQNTLAGLAVEKRARPNSYCYHISPSAALHDYEILDENRCTQEEIDGRRSLLQA